MADENFIRDFVKFNEGTEVPDIFALWCAVAGISCVLGRRVVIDRGHFQIFPNTYIILVAGSGARKSTAIRQIEKIIMQVEPTPNLVSQKITPEALIKTIRQDVTSDGKINFGEECVGFAIVDELSNFLNKAVYDSGLGSLLTPLYDCNDLYQYKTISRGTETLKKLCFGLLGGTTVEWLQEAIPTSAIGGGVTSRMMFVYYDDRGVPYANTPQTPEKRALHERLVQSLRKIATYKGEMKTTEDCLEKYKELYDKWFFNDWHLDKHLRGYAGRRFDHIWKIAMCFSVAESGSMVITLRHFMASVELVQRCEAYLPTVISLITSSVQGLNTSRILTTIRRYGDRGVGRSELMRLFLHQMTVRDMTEILETLKASGRINFSTGSGDVRYFGTKIKD